MIVIKPNKLSLISIKRLIRWFELFGFGLMKALSPIDRFKEYLATNSALLAENQYLDVLQYWQDRYESQPDLARFALNILAVPPISDKCE